MIIRRTRLWRSCFCLQSTVCYLLLGRKHLTITPLAIRSHKMPALRFLISRIVCCEFSQISSCCCHGSCGSLTKSFNSRCDKDKTLGDLFPCRSIFFSGSILQQFRINVLWRDLNISHHATANKAVLQGDQLWVFVRVDDFHVE
jgi:hypothetical protein